MGRDQNEALTTAAAGLGATAKFTEFTTRKEIWPKKLLLGLS